jgi:hypothetical protein
LKVYSWRFTLEGLSNRSSPTGVHPTGVHPTGVHPTGVHPTGVHPTGIHSTRFEEIITNGDHRLHTTLCINTKQC